MEQCLLSFIPIIFYLTVKVVLLFMAALFIFRWISAKTQICLQQLPFSGCFAIFRFLEKKVIHFRKCRNNKNLGA